MIRQPRAPQKRTWTRLQFQQQVRPLLPRLLRRCLVLTNDSSSAEDLLQIVLTTAYERGDTFDGQSLLAWLCQLLRREHRAVTRTEARRRNALGDLEYASELADRVPANAPPDPERWLCNAVETQILIEALQGLPKNYRKVIMLCDLEEMTNEAASTALAVPVNTVKSRRARAKRMLREALASS